MGTRKGAVSAAAGHANILSFFLVLIPQTGTRRTCTNYTASEGPSRPSGFFLGQGNKFPFPKEASRGQNFPTGHSGYHVDTVASLHGELCWIGL